MIMVQGQSVYTGFRIAEYQTIVFDSKLDL